ncbi:MAG: hypothetical protein JJT77_10950 [Crocinitomicaceae bacterium]|nr:hypothetical protein [Crocinitomicaceae bacterium]
MLKRSCFLVGFALACSFISQYSFTQENEQSTPNRVENTFYTSRIINGHSNEVLEKNTLEFRVEHKFGDMFGSAGGIDQFFGLDNSADIRIAFEYGITDFAMVGLGRSKGAGPYRGIIDGFIKSRILSQMDDNSMPLSLTFLGSGILSYVRASTDLSSITSYPDFSHRLAYAGQLIATRNFQDKLSLALMPTYVHRNLVQQDDQNMLFSLGGAFNYKINEKFGVLMEYYHNMNEEGLRTDYSNSLSGAVEWKTFGHVFSIYLSNARGFTEQQFIPYTTSQWREGQFRLGFAIVRTFEY